MAANRDLAIYREATAADAITTANFDHDWDTTVREDTASSNLNGDKKSIKLRSGHYLVLYGSRFDSTSSTNRSEIQSQLRLAGADLPIGWSQGYIRRSGGADEAFTSGGGIINVVGDDDALILRSFRTDANSAAGVQRAANASGIQVLKIDDTWDYARLKRTTPQVGPTSATYLAVQYDSQDELDIGSFSHSTSVNPEAITLKTAGHYLVIANTYSSLPDSVNGRTVVNQKLTLDGSDIDGTLTTVYIRGDQNSNSTQEGAVSTGAIIETSSANQVLKVEVNRGAGANVLTINQDDTGATVQRTAVTIAKLPDGADYIRLSDSGTDNMNPASLTPMGWDTEYEIDTLSFTHPAADSRIEVNYGGEYLFLTTLYAANATQGSREVYNQGWTKNGGPLIQYGQSGNFNRNSGGANDAGNWSGFIAHDLAAGDYIEVEVQALGNSGTVAADVKGIQGVRLASLMPRSFSESPSDRGILGDATGLSVGFPRTTSASLGESFLLNQGVNRTGTSAASAADSSKLAVGFPRTSSATLSDTFTLSQSVVQKGSSQGTRSDGGSSGDTDGDQIWGGIDGRLVDGQFIDERNVFTNQFSDQHLGGSTFGQISNLGGLIVELTKSGGPATGLRALVSGPGETATLVLCADQIHLNLTAGDTVLITCGSLTVSVFTGQAEIDLGPMLAVTVSSGATTRVTDLGNGRFAAENPGASGLVTAVENGILIYIGPGERVEMGPEPAVVPQAAPESPVDQPSAPSILEDMAEDTPGISPGSSETTASAPPGNLTASPATTPSLTPAPPATPLPRSTGASGPESGPISFPPLPDELLSTGLVGAIALGTLTGAAFIAILISLIGLVRSRITVAVPTKGK
ncbi:MAG TPA: hypothetical protein VFR55_13195 [Dehalococcoidia bacterium]|nr:hypothetical protein [Dehalococcoidia bacterium]